jgi:hypothetical protein
MSFILRRRGENNGGRQQFNGREGETATLLSTAFGELGVAWWRFRLTSSQSLDSHTLSEVFYERT